MTPFYIAVCTLDRGMIYLVQKFQEYVNISNPALFMNHGKNQKLWLNASWKKVLIMSFRWNKNRLDCCFIYLYEISICFHCYFANGWEPIIAKIHYFNRCSALSVFHSHVLYNTFFSFIHSYCHSEHKKWWTKNKNQRSSSQLNWIIVSYSDSE